MTSRLEALAGALLDLGFACVEVAGGRIVDADDLFCEVVGYSLDELRALPDFGPLLVPDRRATGIEMIEGAQRGEVEVPETFLLLRRDGTPVEVVAAARPADDRLLLLVRDVSDEARQREQLAAYSEVLQRMPVGMLLWRVDDPDDASSLRIVASNRASTGGSALRPGDLLGMTVDEAFPGRAGIASGELILEAHRTRQVRDLGEVHVAEGEGPFGPGTYRRAIVPLPGDVVASLIENVSARRDAERHRRELLQRIVEAGGEERRRVAAGLHDDVIQTLAAVLVEIDASRRDPDPAALEAACHRVEVNVRAVIARLRLLVFDLAPPELDEGLAAGVDVATAKTFEGTGVAVVTSFDLFVEPDPETRAVVYSMVAEALANVRHHAQASTVRVELRSDEAWLWGTVRDDGKGSADLVTPPGHLGLRTLKERAQMLGGTSSISSTLGEGTTVEFRVPVHQA